MSSSIADSGVRIVAIDDGDGWRVVELTPAAGAGSALRRVRTRLPAELARRRYESPATLREAVSAWLERTRNGHRTLPHVARAETNGTPARAASARVRIARVPPTRGARNRLDSGSALP